MRTLLLSTLGAVLLLSSSASAVTMDWTPIANPGNAADSDPVTVRCGGFEPKPCGAVGYYYNIGTYEVTNAQYAEFLNAKAASDPLALYYDTMGDAFNFGGITRSGSDGSYTYSTIAGREDRPVTYVSFYDSIRFANWLNNGQGSGSTETGAYTLLGPYGFQGTPSNGSTVTRNAEATIFLPSEDEWYKGAYYDASTASYFTYPAGSDAPTTCSAPTATPNSANCIPSVGDLTNKGSYTGSASLYGTFDQGGNAEEWNEANISDGYFRGQRGGAFIDTFGNLAAFNPSLSQPDEHNGTVGFRLAMIPEPGTGLLVIAGLLGLAGWRRGRAQ